MDPENVQDNADCELELPVEHPDFVVKNPDNLDFNQGEVSLPSLYKKIDLYSDGQIEYLSLSLDKEQRVVLDIGVNYAKT